jgi:hypothetical protein
MMITMAFTMDEGIMASDPAAFNPDKSDTTHRDHRTRKNIKYHDVFNQK